MAKTTCSKCKPRRDRAGDLHHQPDCPEMFWMKSDGSGEPDRGHPRGTVHQEELDRLDRLYAARKAEEGA